METQKKGLLEVTIEEIRKHSLEGKKELEKTVLDGKHYPEVEVYSDKETNKWYQVSEEHSLYRETEGTKNPYEAQDYGEWKKLKK